MTDLYRDDDLRVRFRGAGGSPRLIVTFANWSTSPGLAKPGFGEAFCARYGLDAIHVTCAGNHWYQKGDMALALAAVAQVGRNYAAMVTYGASMGGYQAIRAAQALGAERCVAISPQYSIDPAKTPWETRWPREKAELTFREAPLAAADAQRFVLIYDPWEPLDIRHIRAIKDGLATVDMKLPFAGHATMRFLAEAGILSRTMLGLLAEDREPREFRRLVRAGRRVSTTYLTNLSKTLRLPAAWREGALAVAAELSPADPIILMRLAEARLEQSLLDEARRTAERAGALGADELTVSLLLAKIALRSSQWEAAEGLLHDALRLAPPTPLVMHLLGIAQRKLGRET